MKDSARLPGYCQLCQNNVLHIRSVRNRAARLFDRLTFQVAGWLGVGPWYCQSCGQKSILIPPPRKDAGTYNPRSNRNQGAESTESEEDGVRVGNFLESERSIITRSIRSKKYTEKFRHAAVEAILKGNATFTETRKRLELSELDLQDWIATYHQMKLDAVLEVSDRSAFDSSAELSGNESPPESTGESPPVRHTPR